MHGSYDALRLALVADAIGDGFQPRARLRPGMSLLAWAPSDDPAGSVLLMDVLSEPSLPLPGNAESVAVSAKWAASLVVAERLTLGMDSVFAGLIGETAVPQFVPVDVLAVFDVAASKGNSIGFLSSDGIVGLRASEEAKSRILVHLANDQLLLAPKQPVTLAGNPHMGWWYFDPLTGRVRDEFENGRHQELVQNEVNLGTTLQSAGRFRLLGQRICNAMLGSVGVAGLAVLLSGNPAGAEAVRSVADVGAKIVESRERVRRIGEAIRGVSGSGGACGPK